MYILGRAKDDPTIKPKQWGPLSSVQAAVRHNCQRLGLDYSKILSFGGLWEDVGNPFDIIPCQKMDVASTPSWINNGMQFNDGSRNGECLQAPHLLNKLDGLNNLSYLLLTRRNTLTSSTDEDTLGLQWSVLQGSADGNAKRVLFRYASNSDELQLYLFDENSSTYNINRTPGNLNKTTQLGFSWDGVNTNIFQDGSYLGSPGSFSNSLASLSTVKYMEVMGGHNVSQIGKDSPRFDLFLWLLTTEGLSEYQIALLYEQPYALLQRVSRPLIFDLAAGGSVGLTPSDISSGITITNEDISLLRLLKQNNIVASSEVLNETINQIKLLKYNNLNIDSSITTADLTKGLLLAINNISSETQVNEIKTHLIKLLNTSDITTDSSISLETLQRIRNLKLNSLSSSAELSLLDITKLLNLVFSDIQSDSTVTNAEFVLEGIIKLVAADIRGDSAVSSVSFLSILRLLSFNSINIDSEITNSQIFLSRNLSFLSIESYADILDVPNIRIRLINPSDISSLPSLSDLHSETHGYLLSDIIAESEISNVKLYKLSDFIASKDRIVVITEENRIETFMKENRIIQVH